MPYDARAIANWFIDKAASQGKYLTPMKLQKLVYISHGWHLGLFDAPLLHDPIEAWKWGPVIRSLYREFKEFGSGEIDRKAHVLDGSSLLDREISIKDYEANESNDDVRPLLEKVWQLYGERSAAELSNMTHRQGTPWHQMYEQMGNQILPYTVIPNEVIQSHYAKLAQ